MRIFRNVRDSFEFLFRFTSPKLTSNSLSSPSRRLYCSKNASFDLSKYPQDRIRNFSIIAHVDHGKSTLADRLLELTGTISNSRGPNRQILDTLRVEKERGITVKAQTCSLFYTYKGVEYLLNLIDTPGHVDFSYEVSRSLLACQGALLLVDASQGVQAQTMANFYLAFDNELEIIPCINKIDMSGADPDRVSKQMATMFDFEPEKILQISAKTGLNCDLILPEIIEKTSAPCGDPTKPLKMLLFDSWFHEFRGVICLVEVHDGSLKVGDKICSASNLKVFVIEEIGILHPKPVSCGSLYTGQVGYIIAGMKSTKEARVGDTFFSPTQPVDPFPGFKPAKSMVFSGIFPTDSEEYSQLQYALDKLSLNDSSVSISHDSSLALGLGFRLGFLGMLHMDVFTTRLEQEYGVSVISTIPSILCQAKLRKNQEIINCENPSTFPPRQDVLEYYEPMVAGTLVFPECYLGKMITLCQNRRGVQKSLKFTDETRVVLEYKLPLNEIVTDFYDQVKSLSSGYATFEYEENGFEKSDLVKLEILLAGDPVDALSVICHKSSALSLGKNLCIRLSKVIHKQLFEIAIQAKANGSIIARETIPAMRKDVTAKCYGGDVTRKLKLLKKQKEGKKRMKLVGKVEVPREAFFQVIDRNNKLEGK